jgi:hypothetical protein
MLAATNERSGCRGSLTWSRENALCGLRKGSLDTMTLHRQSADGHGQHFSAAMTRTGALVSDVPIPAQTIQTDLATRFDVRRSRYVPSNLLAWRIHLTFSSFIRNISDFLCPFLGRTRNHTSSCIGRIRTYFRVASGYPLMALGSLPKRTSHPANIRMRPLFSCVVNCM